MEKNTKKNIYNWVTLHTAEINTTLQINWGSIKFKNKLLLSGMSTGSGLSSP